MTENIDEDDDDELVQIHDEQQSNQMATSHGDPPAHTAYISFMVLYNASKNINCRLKSDA